ncbi:hypothetical protein Sjap_018840 [Stephania japonica]|uniref:Uncharacterized protein n=1 Tax=Stephania japonica TaxID=461633 RepID=A0AAP0I8U4_9MAGN
MVHLLCNYPTPALNDVSVFLMALSERCTGFAFEACSYRLRRLVSTDLILTSSSREEMNEDFT